MTEEHYKKAYNKEYEKSEKLLAFIESLESQSDDWDKLCDCPASENPMNHEKDCMTIKIRKDIKRLNL